MKMHTLDRVSLYSTRSVYEKPISSLRVAFCHCHHRSTTNLPPQPWIDGFASATRWRPPQVSSSSQPWEVKAGTTPRRAPSYFHINNLTLPKSRATPLFTSATRLLQLQEEAEGGGRGGASCRCRRASGWWRDEGGEGFSGVNSTCFHIRHQHI